jgi:membrane protein implicated in regulation of membrane protease activity
MQSQASQVTRSLMQLLPTGGEQDPLEVIAKVFEVIRPNEGGLVKFQGALWRAHCPYEISLEPGTLVKVIDRQKLTLVVIPLHLARVSLQLVS